MRHYFECEKVNAAGGRVGHVTRFWFDDDKFPFMIADGQHIQRVPGEMYVDWSDRQKRWYETRPLITSTRDYAEHLKKRGWSIIAEG